MRADQFGSVKSLVENAKRVKFLLVLSIDITNLIYKYVIFLWRNIIIDFEEETTIHLTEKKSLAICAVEIQHL